jgi:hypothetical protein
MPRFRDEVGAVWPPELDTYNPADGWPNKLRWYWARLEAGPELGFDPLLQDVTAATVNPDCNPFIKRREDNSDDAQPVYPLRPPRPDGGGCTVTGPDWQHTNS